MKRKRKDKIICWWSGGVTSAVACKIAIDLFGSDFCKVIMIDTFNEDADTYRFKKDCEKWYSLPIHSISAIPTRYSSIEEVWLKYKSLNVASGAVCSSELKRRVREDWQRVNSYKYQVFGFEFDKKEFHRALSLFMNHGKSKPIFPLLMYGYNKNKCIEIITNQGIKIPDTYNYGFRNNNCFKTGCVQGGIGYWQKMKLDFPDKFNAMADMEHRLTDMRENPVTMLRDQSKKAKALSKINKFGDLVFLKQHPDYPRLKTIDDMAGVPVEPLMECNGFCGVNDLLQPNKTGYELNFEEL